MELQGWLLYIQEPELFSIAGARTQIEIQFYERINLHNKQMKGCDDRRHPAHMHENLCQSMRLIQTITSSRDPRSNSKRSFC